jgi:hypothetical protein
MIRKHPNVSDANFDILIDIAIKDAELTGYVSKTRSSNSTICFPGFTSGEHLWAFSKTLNLRSFFPGLICFDSRENQCAILRYCFTKAKQSDKP